LIVLGRLGKHDITHLHVPYHIGIILAPFLLLSNRPLVVSEHWSGYFNEDGRFKGLSITFRVLLRALFFKSKIITVVSRSLADSLSQLFQIGHKIIVVPNVFSKHITVRSLDAIQDGSFLMVANFNNSEKNITGAIDAFWLLYKKYPHIRLKIVGTGPDFEFIRDYKNRLGLTDDVCELTGFVNQTELSQYYHTASCYIMNSNFETFSISTLDALLHGVPVISTKCKGPESFVNASNGLLIEVGNVQQLQSAMEHMITCYTQYHPVSVKSSIPGELLQDIDVAFSNVYKNVIR
jgi:glycosyltransferase involved in cell wall biosynthesis